MKISIIVAASENNVIGTHNKLPWHLSNDLKYFKSLTVGHPILMGRNTYESIGRPLPNRENIVLTSSKNKFDSAITVMHTIPDAIEYCKTNLYKILFIIGGDTIYQQTIHLADVIYLTRVHTIIEEGSAFFPIIDKNEWKLIDSSPRQTKDEKNEFDHTFETYERIT